VDAEALLAENDPWRPELKHGTPRSPVCDGHART